LIGPDAVDEPDVFDGIHHGPQDIAGNLKGRLRRQDGLPSCKQLTRSLRRAEPRLCRHLERRQQT
jgi:hypothetical protein